MIVFFDLDGTIVDETTQIIPVSAVRAVEQLKKNGHLAVVSTGRPYGHIDPRIRQIDFSGWICSCGMEILMEGKPIQRSRPSAAVCQDVIQAVRTCNMQVLYEAADLVYRDGSYSNSPRILRQTQMLRARNLPVCEISDFPRPRFLKFITQDVGNSRKAEFLRRTASHFSPIDRGRGLTEFVMLGYSKARGMRLFMKRMGLRREDAFAIGDSTNDLPIFDAAAHTICMGNGMEVVKQQAEYVTANVLDDGVELALQHYGLI